MWPNFAFVLIGLIYSTLTEAAIYSLDTTACLSAPYSSYLYLSNCPNAVSKCRSYFPVRCSTYVTTTLTSTATTSTPAATVYVTATTTVTKQKNPTATTTTYTTVTKYQTKTTKVTEVTTTFVAKRTVEDTIKRTALKERRAVIERQNTLPASCTSGASILSGSYGTTICPCIESTTCDTYTAEDYTTVTTTLPFTTTQTITNTATAKVTSDIKTITKETVTKITSTVTSTVTKVVEDRPCKNVEKWPLYRQNGWCDGYFSLTGYLFNSTLTACCVECWNSLSCSSFEMTSEQADGPTTCKLYQNQRNGVRGDDPPQCPWGVASNSVCENDNSLPPTVRLGPCGKP